MNKFMRRDFQLVQNDLVTISEMGPKTSWLTPRYLRSGYTTATLYAQAEMTKGSMPRSGFLEKDHKKGSSQEISLSGVETTKPH